MAPRDPRVRRFGPRDRLCRLGEVYLQPNLTTGHWTGEGGSRERGGEKMVWEPDRVNARVAHSESALARARRGVWSRREHPPTSRGFVQSGFYEVALPTVRPARSHHATSQNPQDSMTLRDCIT